MIREVVQCVESVEENEGKGAKVRRTIGSTNLPNLDPFLMLDEFTTKVPAGFPDHPHRGFETVTYVLSGAFSHEDFCGNKSKIEPGDLQWMTAGKGIVHCEMPYGEEPSHGIQLWINLSKHDKMVDPIYNEIKNDKIPNISNAGVHVKIIAGDCMGVNSPAYSKTPIIILDFRLDKGASFTQTVPEDWNGFIYILNGSGFFGNARKEYGASNLLVLSKGNGVFFKNEKEEQLHFILVCGQPLNEAVFKKGPFVMNTQEEIEKAYEDFKTHSNGFEKAAKWRSEGINRSLVSR